MIQSPTHKRMKSLSKKKLIKFEENFKSPKRSYVRIEIFQTLGFFQFEISFICLSAVVISLELLNLLKMRKLAIFTLKHSSQLTKTKKDNVRQTEKNQLCYFTHYQICQPHRFIQNKKYNTTTLTKTSLKATKAAAIYPEEFFHFQQMRAI